MKKIVFVKSLLIIAVIAILGLGLSGCVIIPEIPTTGTVQVKIMNDDYYYYVYMDGNLYTGTYLGTTNSIGVGIFYNIPTGYHSFYAISTDYLYDGGVSKTIYTGNNVVEIYTY
ncbi:MAG: hypothetical protein PHI72_07660 [Atribacterota bacterium]|jgi:hypothetical protein|nr:hypothetical protein [Atribacterota bacterium]MDD4895484.1 hypothetical protein [Atribacterota bacterium]MDD5637863.1 hypothetical protein [Atribacterota bacterium]